MKPTCRLSIILLSVIFLCFLPLYFPVVFSAADDYIMLLITSGAYTGTPSLYAVFEGYFYDWIISRLYILTNSVEWYSIIHYVLSVLCFVFIQNIILKSEGPLFRLVAFVCIFVLQIYLLVAPQFTLLASELSLTSFVLLYLNKYRIVSLFLFLLSVSIRFEAAAIPFLIAFPIYLYPCEVKTKTFCKRISILFLFLFIALFSKFIDTKSYHSNKEWEAYLSYNKERGFLNDNLNKDKGLDVIHNDNEKLEYKLMCDYRVQDGKILDAHKLHEISTYVKKYGNNNFAGNIKAYIRLYYNCGGIVVFLLFLSLCVIGYRQRKGRILLTSLCCLMLFLVVNTYMINNSYPKERTIIPCLVTLECALSISLFSISKHRTKGILVILLLPIIAIYLNKIFIVKQNNFEQIEQADEVNGILSSIPYKKVLIHNYVPIATQIFSVSKSYIGKKLVRGGWMTNSPLTKPYYNGLLSCIDGIPIFCSKEQENFISDQLTLLRDYYHVNTRKEIIYEDSNYEIFRLNSK